MRENVRDHRRIFDGGNDFHGAAAVRATFHVDIEYALRAGAPNSCARSKRARGPDRRWDCLLAVRGEARRRHATWRAGRARRESGSDAGANDALILADSEHPFHFGLLPAQGS